MAITQLSQTSAGTTNFTLLKDEVTKNAKGINQITLSNYDNDSAPVVKVGSVFENDGTTFEVRTSDETPTGYSGISNSTTFYLYFDASATAFIYDSTAPTWDDAKQGYYHPTNTADRAFFSMYKDSGGTLYSDKKALQQIGGYALREKIINIGDWNMDTTASTIIPHGISNIERIRIVEVLIRRDTGATQAILPLYGDYLLTGSSDGYYIIDATNIGLYRRTSGAFDSASYRDTSYNRGWITVKYEL